MGLSKTVGHIMLELTECLTNFSLFLRLVFQQKLLTVMVVLIGLTKH